MTAPRNEKTPYKGLMIILDGLGDRPHQRLRGETPLEAAETPNLDAMVAAGICGMVDPSGLGIPIGTQIGAGLLMGLARADMDKMTRGPVEAAGVGLPHRRGEVALRCNLATLTSRGRDFRIVDRRAGRISEGTEQLAQALDGMDLGDGMTARFRVSTHHRAVLQLAGTGLSAAISDTDPGAGNDDEGLRWSRAAVPGQADAERTAAGLNRFLKQSFAILADHPVNRQREREGLPAANGLLTRGAGLHQPLRNLCHHLGMKVAAVTGEGTLIGLARLFGFSVICQPGFTADCHTDLNAKVSAALAALADHDLVFLHIKGPDLCSHDLDPLGKKVMLEKIDRACRPLLGRDIVIGVSGDHTTDSNNGRHCGDPVPSLLRAPNGRRDRITTFGEAACLEGGLGCLTATAFLAAMLDHMGFMKNYRPWDRPYFCLD